MDRKTIGKEEEERGLRLNPGAKSDSQPNMTRHYMETCCSVIYSPVFYCAKLCCTVLYCSVLYFTALCSYVLFCTVLYCTVM